jgi:hypothetical protein
MTMVTPLDPVAMTDPMYEAASRITTMPYLFVELSGCRTRGILLMSQAR